MKYFEQIQPIPYGQSIILIYEVDDNGFVIRIARHNLATNKRGIILCPFKMKMSSERAMTESSLQIFERLGK